MSVKGDASRYEQKTHLDTGAEDTSRYTGGSEGHVRIWNTNENHITDSEFILIFPFTYPPLQP